MAGRFKEPLTRRQFLRRLAALALSLMGATIFSKYLPKPSNRHNRQASASPKTTLHEAKYASPKDALYEAKYYEKLEGKNVKCNICFRGCVVPPGGRGFCRNKENRDGTYYTLVYNKPCAVHIDPIEKEPAFHMLPGSTIFCIATASCNNRCKFCQNWHISQRSVEETTNYHLRPQDVVRQAKKATLARSLLLTASPSHFMSICLISQSWPGKRD